MCTFNHWANFTLICNEKKWLKSCRVKQITTLQSLSNLNSFSWKIKKYWSRQILNNCIFKMQKWLLRLRGLLHSLVLSVSLHGFRMLHWSASQAWTINTAVETLILLCECFIIRICGQCMRSDPHTCTIPPQEWQEWQEYTYMKINHLDILLKKCINITIFQLYYWTKSCSMVTSYYSNTI